MTAAQRGVFSAATARSILSGKLQFRPLIEAVAVRPGRYERTLVHTARPSVQSLPRQATWVSGRTRTSFAW